MEVTVVEPGTSTGTEAADATKPELDIADVFTATSLVKDRNAKVLPSWRQSRIASADPKRPRPTAEIDEESRDIERTLSELPSWRQSITDSE